MCMLCLSLVVAYFLGRIYHGIIRITRKRTRLYRLKSAVYSFNRVRSTTRAGEPANFLAVPAPDFFQEAPAPDFFPERLRVFFSSGIGSKGPKKNPAPAPDYWLSLAKYSFPRTREAAKKKSYTNGQAIKALLPPPLEVNGHRNFFLS